MVCNLEPKEIFELYYNTTTSELYKGIITHSINVSNKAVTIAKMLHHRGQVVDINFVYESTMLHDIGTIKVHIPKYNSKPKIHFLAHGYLGGEMLRELGYPKHALVCDRHIGVGLPAQLIEDQKIPIPIKDYFPVSIEEKIVTYADFFYSKSTPAERTLTEIINEIKSYDNDKYYDVQDHDIKLFSEWHRMFIK